MLTFDRFFAETDFVRDMRELLHLLHQAYDNPVDIEFTANFDAVGRYRINLVQVQAIPGSNQRRRQPGQMPGGDSARSFAVPVSGTHHRPQSGHGDRPADLCHPIGLQPNDYEPALLSRSHHRTIDSFGPREAPKTFLLLGPGRWGTSMPSLGVPVSFAEINTVSVLCESSLMHAGLVPDVSLGTHFLMIWSRWTCSIWQSLRARKDTP